MKREYWLRTPKQNKRPAFSVYTRLNGKTLTLRDERIDSINKLYKSGVQDAQVCERQLREIIQEYAGTPPKEHYLQANLDIFDRFWTKYCEDSTAKAVSLESRKNAFKRALSKLGAHDLANSPKAIFKAIVDAVPAEQSWVYAGCYNSLLKYIGRTDVKIKGQKRPKPKPAHLSLEQFIQVASHLPDRWKALCWVAFGTGARFGELFAMEQLDTSSVRIRQQWTYDKGVLTKDAETKNRVVRDVGVISEARSWVPKWLATSEEEKEWLRKSFDAAAVMRAACRKAGLTEITFHDLRHSYAIHCLEKGREITDVAAMLGDEVATTQRYYTGYGASHKMAKRFAEGI